MKGVFLMFDIPSKKNYLRTKTWRKLSKMKAELRLGSYWALPLDKSTLNSIRELSNEIVKNGGKSEIIIGEIYESKS